MNKCQEYIKVTGETVPVRECGKKAIIKVENLYSGITTFLCDEHRSKA